MVRLLQDLLIIVSERTALMPKRGRIWIGTSGWVYKDWRGRFYPDDLAARGWFSFYSRHFTTVEINNTFYNQPANAVFESGNKQAPRGFLYAVKANRVLTHRKKLLAAAEIVPRLLGSARLLGNHLGPVLYQLPPHWHANPDRLRSFLAVLPEDLRHVVEFRDPSWYSAGVKELLESHSVGFCIHDLRGVQSPVWATGRFAYIRFHGPTEAAYRGRYGKSRLRKSAEIIREFACCGRDVFAYFNNDVGGAAIDDARDLLELLAPNE
jgi:uncharacterized protein YecE (DUF72 family)